MSTLKVKVEVPADVAIRHGSTEYGTVICTYDGAALSLGEREILARLGKAMGGEVIDLTHWTTADFRWLPLRLDTPVSGGVIPYKQLQALLAQIAELQAADEQIRADLAAKETRQRAKLLDDYRAMPDRVYWHAGQWTAYAPPHDAPEDVLALYQAAQADAAARNEQRRLAAEAERAALEATESARKAFLGRVVEHLGSPSQIRRLVAGRLDREEIVNLIRDAVLPDGPKYKKLPKTCEDCRFDTSEKRYWSEQQDNYVNTLLSATRSKLEMFCKLVEVEIAADAVSAEVLQHTRVCDYCGEEAAYSIQLSIALPLITINRQYAVSQ